MPPLASSLEQAIVVIDELDFGGGGLYTAREVYGDGPILPQLVFTSTNVDHTLQYLSVVDLRRSTFDKYKMPGCKLPPPTSDNAFYMAVASACGGAAKVGFALDARLRPSSNLALELRNAVDPQWATCEGSVVGGWGCINDALERFGGSAIQRDPKLGTPFTFARHADRAVCKLVPIEQAHVFLAAAAEEQWLLAQTTSAEREVAFVLAYGPMAQSGKCAVSAICSLCALSPFPLTPPTLGPCSQTQSSPPPLAFSMAFSTAIWFLLISLA